MIDGLGHGHGRGDVLRFRDLLEERAQSDGEVEDDIVEDIENASHPRAAGSGVTGEDDEGRRIFDAQKLAFPDAVDGPADEGIQEPVDAVVDHEQDGHGMHGKGEVIHEQEEREDGENLPPRPEEERQQVEEPVFALEDHFFALDGQVLVRRIKEQAPDPGQGTQRAHDEEHGRIRQKAGAGEDEDRGGEAPARRQPAQLPHDQRRGAQIKILQQQRLVDGLEKVDTEGHEQRGQDDGEKRGKEARQRRAKPGGEGGYGRNAVLLHDQQDRDDQKAEQSRHLAQRLDQPVVRRGQMRAFHGEVGIEQRPALIAQRGAERQEEQKKVHIS